MEKDVYIAKSSTVETNMRFVDGKWHVTMFIKAKRSLDLQNWESSEIMSVGAHEDAEMALAQASLLMENQIEELDYDIYSKNSYEKDDTLLM